MEVDLPSSYREMPEGEFVETVMDAMRIVECLSG